MRKLIEMRNITKDFLQGDDVIHALKETNFTAYEGELIAIIGPSGSGKSTFLTILGGLQTPTTGEVLIDGKPFSRLSLKDRSNVRFNQIGFILQAANLIPFLRISDQMYLYNRIERSKANQTRLDELYTRLGIAKLAKKYPAELSGGERQRVAIAKALYHDPVVVLADEPTAALDTARAFEVIRLLAKETKDEKKATIMVTHDERLTAFCDKVYVIIDGVMQERLKEEAST
ncbi:MAG: ABC transporter ATP-binding protein [Bacilli bacterium]|jgi:putative ABC transport system ATP-binding protein|nr:ABC transporter ATP-binding protein [Bacilli bacterium]MDD3388815.1 ABC transporter ATP-binding protein [Bacilli bacterium]MDD4344605.1 ABC transporter ATP-binding protein [Bacilli bacterium]MDD4520499.1 ABC transporter ATP-binding protein [Bacilli bacterium]MDY0399086.1 ABC transporter ATP-binding protein [Bacilli bacterium]